MSKICRTFAPNFEKTMSKMQYIQPIVQTLPMLADAHLMLLDSSTGLQPAPARRSSGEVIE